MKNAIVKLGFCLFFFCTAYTAFATGPVPTVTRKSPSSPTMATSVIFQIDFDVNVTGFGDDPATDFLLSGAAGTAAGVTASLTNTVNAKKYEVTVTGLTVSGTVGLDIKASAANASSGGAASELSTGSQTFTFNGNPQPQVTHTGQASPSVNTDIIKFQVDFGETVTDFDGTQIKYTGSGASMTNLSVDHITATTPNQIWDVFIKVDIATAKKGEDIVVSITPGSVHDSYGNGNDDIDNSTVTYGGVAPTVSNTSITSNETTFTIQGNVTFDGGDNAVKRGSVWKQGSAASTTDNATQSGTGGGSFSQLRNDGSIQSGKLYYVTAYADNGNGGIILATPQLQVYTLSALPGSNSNITQIDVISATALDVNFDKFQGFSNTQGMIVLRSESPLTGADIVDGKAPTTTDMPTIVGIITSNTQTKFSDPADALPGTPALVGGHTYNYAVVPFNWNTTNSETYNYKSGFTPSSATTKSASSQIKLNSAPATLAYINRTTSSPLTGLGDGMNIADFTLYDGDGITNDPDALPTKIQTLTIHVDNFAMVNRIAVYDNGTIHDEGTLDASGNITFSIGAGALESGDNNTGGGSPDQFNIIASFNAANVDEGAIIKVTITGATLYSGSSDLLNSAAGGANTGSQNAIEVTATDYTYAGNPAVVDANVLFGVTVTAVDANGKVDKNLTGNIVLSEATMTPASKSIALSSGVATFTNNLQFADAGNKTIAVNSSTTGPMGKSFPITVNSLGIIPTYPNAAASTMCVNSTSTNANPASWYDFGPIVIAESDKTDFGLGADQSFALMLPANFIFDTSTNPTLTSSATADISATITPLSYIGNNILRFKYDITGQATKDIITINHLKIKYVGTDSVKNVDIVRVGGTAIQKKNDDGMNSHGKLFALYKISGVSPGLDFRNTNGGSIKPNETRFPKASSTPIVLQGSLTAGPTDVSGVFTGDGIALDTDGKYKFYPSSVSLGSHPITFTYVDAGGCKTAITRVFEVFASSITGLALQYCDNSAASTLTGQSAFPSSYMCADLITQQYTFDYYVYYNPSIGWQPLGGSTTTGNDSFDPSAAIYQPVYQNTANIYGFYGLFIGYQVVDHCFGGSFVWTYDVVRVERKPTASITSKFDFVCSNGIPIALKGNPNVTTGSSFDKFWMSDLGTPGDPDHPSLTGVVGNSTIGFSFDPSVGMNGATGSKTMQLNYRYQASNGCSDQTFITFTEFEQPAVIASSVITIDATAGDLAAEFCETEKIGETTASNPGGTFYNWYSNALVRLTTDNDKFDPNKSLDTDADGKPNVGTVTFKVTQTTNRQGATFLGCESDPLSFTIEVIKAPVVQLTTNTVNVCNGQDVTLADLAGVITPNTLPGNWSTTTSTSAQFKNSTGTTGVTSLQLSRTYTPVQADKDNKGVIITLTSDVPADGVCAATSKSILVNVNGSLSVLPMTQTVICGTDPLVPTPTLVTLTGVVQNNSVNDANAALHWTTSNGAGVITNGDNQTMQYQPTQAELDAGTLIQFKAETDDPDAGGPCASDFKNTTIKINKRAIIEAGNPFSSCSDVTIPLNGQIVTGSAAVTVAWTGGAGIITSANQPVASYQTDATEQTGQTQLMFTLTSTDPDGGEPCPIVTDNLFVNLYPKPTVPDILGYAPTDIPNYKYCVNDVLADLSAIGIEVTWYADAALSNIRGTGNTFPPAAGGASTAAANNYSFWVTQTTNKLPGILTNGCRSDGREVQITVNPLPIPSFTAANFCLSDQTQFTDASTVPGARTITEWSWDFADNLVLDFGGKDVPVPPGTHRGATSGTFNNPTHVFGDVDKYNVKLTVKSSDGCLQSIDTKNLAAFNNTELRIGAKPKADFNFVKICDGDDTQFNYAGTIADQIPTYDWDFDDGSPIGSGDTTLHQFPGVGRYQVTLTTTTDLGCTDVITRVANIVPYVTTFPYIENFESNTHGWFAEGLIFDGSNSTPGTSWDLLTTADKIGSGVVGTNPSAAAGPTFWVTHTNAGPNKFYFDNERSALYGPCVDMTALSRPVIALDYFNDTEPDGDGAYVEYKIEDADGKGTWERLGNNVQGLEWYNGASIGGLSSAGGIGQAVSQYGWTGSSIPEGTTNVTGWKTGRYNLDNQSLETRLRFRIVFGSNTSANPNIYDGFAVDYFKLESRNRLVLVENFTSASSSSAVTNNTSSFQAFPSGSSSSEVVKIEYHTSLPAVTGDAQDPIYKQNPMDPSGRASFYGLSAVPRGYIDGYTNLDASGSFYSGTESDFISVWSKNYYGTESLKTSPITINIQDPTIDNGVINIKGTVTATETELLANHYSLYVAVVEKNVGIDAYVLRKMLPSASGLKVPATPQGGSFDFDQSWSIERSSLGSSPELIAVAFVQSDVMNANKERTVLQAAFNDQLGPEDINYTTGIEKTFLEQTALYPNPADKIATIELPQATKTGVEVNVIDQLGRPVVKSSIGIGQRSTSINTTDLSGAVYIIQLKENGVLTTRKLLVTHSQH